MELQYYHIPFGCILQQYYLHFCCFYSIFIIILFIRGIITHLGHSLPSKLRHIMIYLSLIVTAYGAPCIKQTCKQIALDIPHLSSIFPKTIYYILYMQRIKLQKFAFYQILWIHISSNANLLILRQNCLQYQVIDSLHHLLIIWMS